jgi:hypothetical protein
MPSISLFMDVFFNEAIIGAGPAFYQYTYREVFRNSALFLFYTIDILNPF